MHLPAGFSDVAHSVSVHGPAYFGLLLSPIDQVVRRGVDDDIGRNLAKRPKHVIAAHQIAAATIDRLGRRA
jgi:hypothetical protein